MRRCGALGAVAGCYKCEKAADGPLGVYARCHYKLLVLDCVSLAGTADLTAARSSMPPVLDDEPIVREGVRRGSSTDGATLGAWTAGLRTSPYNIARNRASGQGMRHKNLQTSQVQGGRA